MEREVYADLYFLINAGMDLICLCVTSALLHRRTKTRRLLAAAAIGGGYSLLSLLLDLGGAVGLICDLFAAALLCAAAFAGGRNRGRGWLRTVPVQFLVSMTLGGIMTALYALLNRMDLPLGELHEDGISVWLFALLGGVAAFATLRGGRFFGLSQKTKSVTVTASLFGKEVTLRAMIDTGNLAQDPVSGKGVIVAERSALAGVLPPALQSLAGASPLTDWTRDYGSAKYLRLIPVRTAAGEALLPALIPDSLTVDTGKERYDADYLIALSDLGQRAPGFDAVLPPG